MPSVRERMMVDETGLEVLPPRPKHQAIIVCAREKRSTGERASRPLDSPERVGTPWTKEVHVSPVDLASWRRCSARVPSSWIASLKWSEMMPAFFKFVHSGCEDLL